VRLLYQRGGCNNNLHRPYPPVLLNKSLWLLLILTLLLLPQLQPPLLFQIQKAPATHMFMHIPRRLVLSIPDLEFQWIRPWLFHTSVHQNSLPDERVWIYRVVVPPEVDPHQPTPIENLIIYRISINLIRTRILAPIPILTLIRSLVAI